MKPAKVGTHTHVYGLHPTLVTHVACTICGFAVHGMYLQTAITAGAKATPEASRLTTAEQTRRGA